MNLEEIINYNLQSDFEVLSDYAFLGKELYLASLVLGPRLNPYNLKRSRTDQDGVIEKEGTPELSFLHFEKIAERNRKLKENFEQLTGKIFYNPVETQEKEIVELLKECKVKFKDFVYAGQEAVRKFRPVENTFKFVSTMQRKLYYYFEVFSGVFEEARIEGYPKSFAGPLKLFWRSMGLTEKQIHGSILYSNRNGEIQKIVLRLEHRKRDPIENFSSFLIGFTDNLKGDFPMMDINVNTIPIALLFKGMEEIPSCIAIPCPEARKDMMKAINYVQKIERAFVEEIGKVDIKKAECIGREIIKIYNQCQQSDENLFKYRGNYVENSLKFLDTLTLNLQNGKYPLLAERKLKIREYLDALKNTKDIKRSKKLLEDTCNILKKYSAEFPKESLNYIFPAEFS